MARPKKYPPNHVFIRICSDCGVEIQYRYSSQYHQAERLNRKCKTCGCGHFRGKSKDTSDALKQTGEKNSVRLKGKPTWNKGLTKDQHLSLATIGEKSKNRKHSDESLKKISDASKQHWGQKRYRELVSQKVKEVRGLPEIIEKWRKTGELNGSFTPLEKLSEWQRYHKDVWKYTNKNNLTLLENHDRRGKAGVYGAYHLDHIVSIFDGFANDIDAKIIGSIHNLRFIPAEENVKKSSDSHMEIQTLTEKYYGTRQDKIL